MLQKNMPACSRLRAMKYLHVQLISYRCLISCQKKKNNSAYSEFIWTVMTVYVIITGGFYCLPLKGLI